MRELTGQTRYRQGFTGRQILQVVVRENGVKAWRDATAEDVESLKSDSFMVSVPREAMQRLHDLCWPDDSWIGTANLGKDARIGKTLLNVLANLRHEGYLK